MGKRVCDYADVPKYPQITISIEHKNYTKSEERGHLKEPGVYGGYY
jgi:hypothetical protein